MKKSVDKQRIKIYLAIGGVYLGFWLFHDLIENPETFFKRAWNNIWLMSYLVTVNYFFFEFAVASFRFTVKRILLAPFVIFGFFLMLSIVFYGWRSLGISLGLYFELREHVSIPKGIEYHLPYSMFAFFFIGIVKHAYDYRQLKAAARQLQLEKKEAELNYLKSQTNPHFLFNTLNNIYSLSRDKSDLAPESILRLSKILRFMLYETSGSYIAIEQELKIMNDYIELEKLRYDESLRINFNHDVEDMKQAVPPLLLIPLVENAFKHGVSETRSQPFVDIHLSVKGRRLKYIVTNSAETSVNDAAVRENIGLSNLRRQLELLYTDYDLSVQHHHSKFIASLTINLGSHV